MSTIDKVSRNYPCPCGHGTITITECSPDHLYARNSQTWYEAEIDCDECKSKFTIDQKDDNEGKRYIVIRPHDEDSEPIHITTIDMFSKGLIK